MKYAEKVLPNGNLLFLIMGIKARYEGTTYVYCRSCEEIKVNQGGGLCRSCYYRLYRRANREVINARKKERYTRLGGHSYRRNLNNLLKAQDYTCALMATHDCQQRKGDLRCLDTTKIHIDHIWPIARADEYEGDDIHELSNLQAVCERCNKFKYDKIL